METFGSILLELNPWWFVVAAISLILIDLAIFATEYLLFLGIAALLLLVPRLATDNPILMTWSIPLVLLISYLISDTILKLLFKHSEKSGNGENIVGAIGEIKILEEKNLSQQLFYSYRSEIPHESKITSDSEVSLRVTLPNGQVIPLTNPSGLAENDKVEIVHYDGVNATVKKM